MGIAPLRDLSLRHVALGSGLCDHLSSFWEVLEAVFRQHVLRRGFPGMLNEPIDHSRVQVTLKDQPKELVARNVVVCQAFIVGGI